MPNLSPKIIFFTGKGGVGKTTLALAYAKHLKAVTDLDVTYFAMTSHDGIDFCQSSGISHHFLDTYEEAKQYVLQKVKQETLAKWISSFRFFKSIIEILPGLQNVILLGSIINFVRQSKNKIAIFDAPATGHFLSLLESQRNFRDIFIEGVLFEDTQKIWDFLQNPQLCHIHLVSYLSLLPTNETNELYDELIRMKFSKMAIKVFFNKVYHQSSEIFQEDENIEMPEHFQYYIEQEKIQIENILKMNKYKGHIIPFVMNNDRSHLIQSIAEKIGFNS